MFSAVIKVLEMMGRLYQTEYPNWINEITNIFINKREKKKEKEIL